MHVNTFKKLVELGNSQNNTLRFLMPLIYANGINSDSLVTEPFIGAYIKDADKDEYTDKLLLVYKNDSEQLAEIANLLTKSKLFLDTYDKSNNRTVFVFDITGDKQQVLEIFKEGRYTDFPTLYKTNIMKFWNLEYGDDMFTHILYGKNEKDERENLTELTEEEQKNTTENELWPIPNMSEETLK